MPQAASSAASTARSFRSDVRAEDRDHVRATVSSTGFFTAAEIAVAVELIEERLLKGIASGYHFLFAEEAGKPLGYACYGPVPATLATWDLYWIAVHSERQREGLGRMLLDRVERAIADAGGRD